jgi:rod shape-determining protein MreC
MALPDIRQRSGYLLAVVVVGQIILISAQVNARPGVSLLRAAVFGAFAEVQRASGAAVEGTRGVWNGYVALRGVREENVTLAARLRDLEVALQRERALAGESRQLRQLLALRDRTDLPTRAADIVGSSPTADFRTLTINLGTGDGVGADMAVVAPTGAVGRVVTPSRHAAKVQLLVDRNAAVAVMIVRSRVQGIAMGSGENLLRLEYVPGSADLVNGDEVVTSGIDGIYPPGFAVGRVEAIERLGGSFRSIRVRPAVDFSTLEQVLVVMARPAPAAAGEKAP